MLQVYCIPHSNSIIDTKGKEIYIDSWVLNISTKSIGKVINTITVDDSAIVIVKIGHLIKKYHTYELSVIDHSRLRNTLKSHHVDGKCIICKNKVRRDFVFCPYCGMEFK